MFIPDNAHKQNLPPYQHKVCARPSEIFHTSYPVFSIAVLRETTSREHTISVSLKFVDDDVGNFSTTSFQLFSSLAKLVFNSVSCIKLVSEVHDVCHCQIQKPSIHQKTLLSQII